MTDVDKEKRRLYKDALYFHLIHKGYSNFKAEYLSKLLYRDNENFF
jgi:hypothetical protein